jgi:plastocyanin
VVPPSGSTASSSGDASRRARRERSVKPGAGGAGDASPMDFWRSGRARSHRDRPVTTARGPQGLWKRITNMYFPPWVPVVGIIFVVFGVLALLFITRSATGAPRIGEDHWHATYTFYACGDKQPAAPTWEGVGVHTHGDGVVHIHPFTAAEEGSGARLVKWFDYGSGKLDSDEIRLPGLSKTWKDGEVCPEGTPDAGREGQVQIFVNSVKLEDYSRYIPKDGDRIRMIFGPENEVVQLDDRQVIDEEQATREVTITITDDPANEAATRFNPASIQLDAGETVKVIVQNDGAVSHGVRFNGEDLEYDTGDDFVVIPTGSDPTKADQGDVLQPGAEGFTVIRFDQGGQLEFKDPTASNPNTDPPEPFATGTVIVRDTGTGTPSPTPAVDTEIDIEMTDDGFEPDEITVDAGEPFKLALTNSGEFLHNIRIAGPDGEFDTDDDIVSNDVAGGETGELNATIEEPGEYEFHDQYHVNLTGTLIVE